MFNDITQPPPPLPAIQHKEVIPGVDLLSPLSRRGHGPGLIVLVPDTDSSLEIKEGVPWPLIKWAEEGYTVVQLQKRAVDAPSLRQALEALSSSSVCDPKDKVGLVSYDQELWNLVAPLLPDHPSIVAASSYGDASQEANLKPSIIPVVHHLAGKPTTPTPSGRKVSGKTVSYYYPDMSSYKFATPFHPTFHYVRESLSHSRNLSHLKPVMGGPYFDLETIWEEHTYYEFADRSVEHTMSTMVQEPYVNHVPTMTGGIGRAPLSDFYRNHFIFNNSDDTDLELISRSMGIDRIVDEFIFKFTHDREIDWMIPGIPPTGISVQVPFTSVVNIRGDRLYHEHIAWDQGTLLRQLGLLPEFLPYPHPLPAGMTAGPTGKVEYKVPVAGIETAQKLRERDSVPSNEMFEFKIRTS